MTQKSNRRLFTLFDKDFLCAFGLFQELAGFCTGSACRMCVGLRSARNPHHNFFAKYWDFEKPNIAKSKEGVYSTLSGPFIHGVWLSSWYTTISARPFPFLPKLTLCSHFRRDWGVAVVFREFMQEKLADNLLRRRLAGIFIEYQLLAPIAIVRFQIPLPCSFS